MLLIVAQLRNHILVIHLLHSLLVQFVCIYCSLKKWHFLNIKIVIFILWLYIWLLLRFYISNMNVVQIARVHKVIRTTLLFLHHDTMNPLIGYGRHMLPLLTGLHHSQCKTGQTLKKVSSDWLPAVPGFHQSQQYDESMIGSIPLTCCWLKNIETMQHENMFCIQGHTPFPTCDATWWGYNCV